MSNSSYLICIGATRATKDLYAENTLPDGWAQLFAPDELFRGDPRDHAVAATLLAGSHMPDRTISSFLFCRAADGLARFAERMRARGHLLTGRGTIARVHAWLEKHMTDGYWYADTTELEWMDFEPGAGFASMQGALTRASDPATPFPEPSPDGLLWTFGWGTGLSTEEKASDKARKARKRAAVDHDKRLAELLAQQEAARAVAEARKNPTPISALQGRPYSLRETFKVGDQIAHPVFQTGTVTAVTPTTITVKFAVGNQLLAHARK